MSVFGRLYRGDTNVDFVGSRKRWYLVSAALIAICVLMLIFRGFNFGIEFAGGNQFRVPASDSVSLEQVRDSVESQGIEVASAQARGTGAQRTYVVRTGEISQDEREQAIEAVASSVGVTAADVSSTQVSSSWGDAVTNKALIALAVFLVVVGAYIWIRFEQKMAIAALLALLHDLLLTAGAYSIIGFEVTPSTVIGLLTILGFSLYDTVVVFDKVSENTRGLLGQSRISYAEAANAAVNQTLMRSINTTLIALLPVAGLLFIGAGVLGVGTLKDLALVLFVGMLTGAYSSLFLATPWLVDLKLMEPRYRLQAQRVGTVRAKGSNPAKVVDGATEPGSRRRPAGPAKTTTRPVGSTSTLVVEPEPEVAQESEAAPRRAGSGARGASSRPGSRPARPRRQGGKRR